MRNEHVATTLSAGTQPREQLASFTRAFNGNKVPLLIRNDVIC